MFKEYKMFVKILYIKNINNKINIYKVAIIVAERT